MKKRFIYFAMMTFVLLVAASFSWAGISASTYKAGDVVQITGKVAPGQDLYIAIAQQNMFSPKDTQGVHEVKKFKKMSRSQRRERLQRVRQRRKMMRNHRKDQQQSRRHGHTHR